jgi:hypothetical protein
MIAAAKKPAKSEARAAGIASFMSAMGEPRKVVPKKEAAVVVLDDDDADDTFASFAEREKKKILDLGIEPDEEYLHAEINRRWELKGRGKSVALKAKATSKGPATVTSSKVVNPEKKEKESAEDGEPFMHMIDTKLDAATAKYMGVEFAGEIKGKFLYKNIEAKDVQEGKEGKKANESKAEVAKPSAVAAAKPKPSPKAKSSPPKAASLSGSSKKRKTEEKAAFKSDKKAKAKDEDEIDFGDLTQSAEHWTQVAAGRLMVKCAHNAEARAHIQGLLNVFGVTLSAKVLASKSVSHTEVSELARQMHYETDNGEEDEEEEAPHEDAPHYFVGKDDSNDDEDEEDEEADDDEAEEDDE